jgi:hypothetical protein
MNEPAITPEERRSRIERSRMLLYVGFFLLALGVACLFLAGPKTGVAFLVLGSIVIAFWTAFPYLRGFDLSATRLVGQMSDPKGGVEELTEPEGRPVEPQQGQSRRLRRLLRWRPRSRGSAPD